MKQSDQEYFTRRAVEERAAAERAESAEARASHLGLAERYEAAAEAAAGVPIVRLAASRSRAAD